MSNKKYSAGLVSQSFWFYEIKQYIEMINEGKAEDEIKTLSEDNNIFNAVSSSRAKETFNGVRRRVNILDQEMYKIFSEVDVDNQRIIVFIAILLMNDLFLEFQLEVYQDLIKKEISHISTADFRAFFSEKQKTNDIVSSWKQYTYKRLAGSFRKYLVEAGLLRPEGNTTLLTPKLIDPRIVRWLRKKGRLDIVNAIGGVIS